VETLTRSVLGAALTLMAVLSCATPSKLLAQAIPLTARVIWAQGDRAYLAASDSTHLELGATLHFFDRKKAVASARISGIQDAMVVARLTSGSLKKVKHLDRLRVTVEHAAPDHRSVLRVGYPSRARVQPFFECRRMVLMTRDYRADTLGERSYRLVRTAADARPGPDTLLVRLFDDGADEEIALERGELDAAVFWPGEASNHIREQMLWNGAPKAVRTQGLIGVHSPSTGPLPEIVLGIRDGDKQALDRLDAELFRGDLDVIQHARIDSSTARAWSLEVDPSLPGRESIRRALGEASRPSGSTIRVTLTFIDEPIDRPRMGDDTDPFLLLYHLGCPVLSAPELRPYLESIDLSAIVNLFDCVTPARKP